MNVERDDEPRISELMEIRQETLRQFQLQHPNYLTAPARRRYRADRGGHAPGHLRDAFLECLERFDCGDAEPWHEALADDELIFFFSPDKQRWWEGLSSPDRGHWLIGQLWNCTDVMPSRACSSVELPQGSSYARAARKLRSED